MSLIAPRFKWAVCALFLLALAAPPMLARQAAQTIKLAKIEFSGLDKLKPEDALAKSGLAVGQTADVPDAIDAAAARLMDSGLFKNLSYSIKGTSDNATLTFKVEELKGGLPVVFDNFVWFTDDELSEAVRRRVPTFNGVVPEEGNAGDQIKRALEDLLRERKLRGTVDYMPSVVPGKKPEMIFNVRNSGLRLCQLSYKGARAFTEDVLVNKSAALFREDYSRFFASAFVEGNLLPLYHERGYLRAAFSPPQVREMKGEDCDPGFSLTFLVDEGAIYTWEKSEWAGNQSLQAQELDAALGMRQREVAGSVKIEKGLNAVRKAYGRKGFLFARISPAAAFDDTGRTVSYRFAVEEGPQFRMGDVRIEGLPEAETNNLRGRWRILHGEVYDEGYLDQFVKKNVGEFFGELIRQGRPLPKLNISASMKPDREKRTVDVTITFKPEGAK
ncbi:MAG TPA: POTRA domain-containing protein [Pyrinomonadaceae bacterium]|nr:POTRA domain-containing protein [Pyrinomonadaceae bacterium]